jgi:hypothetical protein
MERSPFRVPRWVLRKRHGGQFAADADAGYFSDTLADAYVFVGRPRGTVSLEAVPVVVTLEGHEGEAEG